MEKENNREEKYGEGRRNIIEKKSMEKGEGK